MTFLRRHFWGNAGMCHACGLSRMKVKQHPFLLPKQKERVLLVQFN
jgi:hypothetical protein